MKGEIVCKLVPDESLFILQLKKAIPEASPFLRQRAMDYSLFTKCIVLK
jgi:hypothetical protein